ncbi:MAG: hypothetical protein MI863_14880 [Desulfobacterales bacterium]|nr:hypothetical protein [Desulfobacterales bacterium]
MYKSLPGLAAMRAADPATGLKIILAAGIPVWTAIKIVTHTIVLSIDSLPLARGPRKNNFT